MSIKGYKQYGKRIGQLEKIIKRGQREYKRIVTTIMRIEMRGVIVTESFSYQKLLEQEVLLRQIFGQKTLQGDCRT